MTDLDHSVGLGHIAHDEISDLYLALNSMITHLKTANTTAKPREVIAIRSMLPIQHMK